MLMLVSLVSAVLALPPFDFTLLGILALVPLFVSVIGRSLRDAFWLLFLFGLCLAAYAYFGVLRYSAGVYVIACLAIGLLHGALGMVMSFTYRRHPLWLPWLAALTWGSLELLMQALHLPWSYALLVASSVDLIQPAAVAGAAFVAMCLVGVNLSVALIVKRRLYPGRLHTRRSSALLLSFVVLSLIWSHQFSEISSNQYIIASAVQTRIPPRVIAAAHARAGLEDLAQQQQYWREQLRQGGRHDLVVWPEVAFAQYQFRHAGARRHVADYAELVASPDLDSKGQTHNALFAISHDGRVLTRQDKKILIPWLERDFIPAQRVLPHYQLPGKVGALICFESAFAEQAVTLTRQGAQLLAISTNDSYAGPSILPMLHAQLARLRAVETRRSIIRAANGGPSLLLDPYGNSLGTIKLFDRGLLSNRLPLNSELSFYSRYHGQITLVIVSLTLLLLLHVARRPALRARTHLSADALWYASIMVWAALFVLICLTVQYHFILGMYQRTQPRPVLALSAFQLTWDEAALDFTNLHVRDVHQSPLASFGYIMRRYGIATDLLHLQQLAEERLLPLPLLLDQMAAHYGYRRVGPMRVPGGNLNALLPAMVQLRSTEHYVLTDLSDTHAMLFSPTRAREVAITRAAFEAAWDGRLTRFLPHLAPWDDQASLWLASQNNKEGDR